MVGWLFCTIFFNEDSLLSGVATCGLRLTGETITLLIPIETYEDLFEWSSAWFLFLTIRASLERGSLVFSFYCYSVFSFEL
jgi:hypothetical protein